MTVYVVRRVAVISPRPRSGHRWCNADVGMSPFRWFVASTPTSGVPADCRMIVAVWGELPMPWAPQGGTFPLAVRGRPVTLTYGPPRAPGDPGVGWHAWYAWPGEVPW